MKTNKLIAASIIFTIIFTSTAFGQRARNFSRFSEETRRELRDCNLELTSEQKDMMADLRKARLEANKERRENLASLRQQRHELRLEKEVDLHKVNAIVDEMALLRAEIEKENIKFRYEFSALLTDDQKQTLNNHEKRERRFEPRRANRPRGRLRN